MTRVRSSDGTQLAVYESGAADAPVLVCVHGYPDDHTVWDGLDRRAGDRVPRRAATTCAAPAPRTLRRQGRLPHPAARRRPVRRPRRGRAGPARPSARPRLGLGAAVAGADRRPRGRTDPLVHVDLRTVARSRPRSGCATGTRPAQRAAPPVRALVLHGAVPASSRCPSSRSGAACSIVPSESARDGDQTNGLNLYRANMFAALRATTAALDRRPGAGDRSWRGSVRDAGSRPRHRHRSSPT